MKVLVTRLEADGNRTAARLLEAGFEPVLLPLATLRTTSSSFPKAEPDFAIFTSAHGVEFLASGQENILRDLPVYAVGHHTADALEAKTYTDIRIGPGTASSLADLIRREQQGRSAYGHYYCGRERAFDFVSAFSNSDIGLDLFEVYSLVDREPDPGVLHATLEEVQGGAALVYSTNGAKRLAHVIMKHGSPDFQAHLTVISISEHAAWVFRNIQVGRIVIAAEPTENAMIAALRDCIR